MINDDLRFIPLPFESVYQSTHTVDVMDGEKLFWRHHSTVSNDDAMFRAKCAVIDIQFQLALAKSVRGEAWD